MGFHVLNHVRRHLVGYIALLFALSGTSYAAATLINGSQIKPHTIAKNRLTNQAIHQLRGNRGARGSQGPQGPTGAQGPAGAQGAQGIQGPPGPFPGDLPAGKTVRGDFAMSGYDSIAGSASVPAVTEISFVFRFATAPTAHVILAGGTPPAECPGTVAAPEATSGNLCIYEADSLNRASLDCFDSALNNGAADRTGAILRALSSADNAPFESHGTWAATG